MSSVLICDVCGCRTDDSGRFELTYKCVIRTEKKDICYECFEKLVEMTQSNKKTEVVN